MKRFCKFVAVLVFSGLVAAPPSPLFAYSVCIPQPENLRHGCHAVATQQSSSVCHLQATDGSCCQIVPALPARGTSYAVASPNIPLTHFTVALSNVASQLTNATSGDFAHRSLYCRSQAVLCTFLI
jgi:hypothetical protein